MNYFDIIIGALLVFAFVRGIIKGFFSEVAALVAIVLGIYVAIHYSYHVEMFLGNSPTLDWSSNTEKVVAFCFTFLVVVILIIFIGKILTKIADITALGMLNKLLGGIFGTLKTALILSVLFILFESVNNSLTFIDKKTLNESLLYNRVKSLTPAIFPAMVEKDKDGKQKLVVPKQYK